jgi:NAD(P)-dependent dehydrogenase (short-subunit alcohol dehydrogenase family)
MKASGKTFIVTGGGNGIGRQIVLELLRRGASVAAVDIRREALDETAASVASGQQFASFVVDITDADAVSGVVAQVVERFGSFDGVVNVAGIIQPFVTFAELDPAVVRRVIDVNLWGTIHVLQATLPHLRGRPEAHVVNVSSMGGFLPVPGQAIYGASKAAVKLLSEALWTELRDTRVGVSVVMPGGVSTDISTNSGVRMPMVGSSAEDSKFPLTTPERAAEIIVDGMEAGKLHVYVGKDARVMGLLVRLAPKQAAKLIQRQMKSLLAG